MLTVRTFGDTDGHLCSEAEFPSWWSWDLSFTPHAELRMEQRGVTAVDVRAMLERPGVSRASWTADS